MKTILLLSSNREHGDDEFNSKVDLLNINTEFDNISRGLTNSQSHSQFSIVPLMGARPQDIERFLSSWRPQIVHFSGHGNTENELIFENENGEPKPISGHVLASILKNFSNQVECVVLNACYSQPQAEVISEHINYVIGMSQAIPDDAAIAFSQGFYDSIGDKGSIEAAFDSGCRAIEMAPIRNIDDVRLDVGKPWRPVFEPEDSDFPPLPAHFMPELLIKQQLTTIQVKTSAKHSTPVSEQTSLIGHSDLIRSIAFSPDGTTLLSGSNDRTLRLWDLNSGTLLHLLTGHRDRIKGVSISPDGQTLLSSSADGQVKCWKKNQLPKEKTGECLYTTKATSQTLTLTNVLPLSPNLENPYFITGASHGKVSFWNLNTGEWQKTITAHSVSNPVLAAAFSNDGKLLATGSRKKTIKLWDVEKSLEEPLYTIGDAHLQEIYSLAIQSERKLLVSVSADRTIKLWDLETGEKHPNNHILKGHAGNIWCVAISPDGTKLASASGDYTVKVWDLQTGSILQTLTGHIGEVRTVAFSPDGQLLASAGDDLEIKLWKDFS